MVRQPAGQPEALFFINTAHPNDATTRDSLSQIRSHVAKGIQARARKSRLAASLVSHRRQKREGRISPGSKDCNTGVANTVTRDRTPEGTAAKVVAVSFSLPPDVQEVFSIPCALPFWKPARSLSDAENLLLDHYIRYIVPFGNGSCHKNWAYSRGELIAIQLNHWIPFALSDPGLIAAVLLQASRSLEASSKDQRYMDISTVYRLQCIQSLNASLLSDSGNASDASIAKVIIMAFDELVLGNVVECHVHFAAIQNMIQIRGGVDALGVGGFLKEVIVNFPVTGS